ncbi:MAG: hypothetical protein AAB368_02395, partial [bacterium]
TTISSLGEGLVRSTSAVSLYTDTASYLTSALTSISALTGPVVHVATTSDTNIQISISTSTANTLTFIPGWTGQLAVSRGGTGAASFAPGFSIVGNGTNALANGLIRDNGTVAGINGTSSTVSFLIQTGGGLDPFTISSTTSANYFTVKANGLVGIGSSSPIATLSVQGTSTLPSTPVLIVSSSTGTSLLTVASNGSTTISNLGTGIVQSANGSLFTSNQLGNASATALTVSGQTTLATASSTGLTVSGSSYLQGLSFTNASGTNQSLSGNLYVSGSSNLSSAILSGTLNVTGQTTLANASTTNLTVTNASYFNTINATGQVTFASASTTALTVSGPLYVTGTSNLASAILSGTLNVTGNTTLANAS